MAFERDIFEIFDIDTLGGRMESIKEHVHPVFTQYGGQISTLIAEELKADRPPVHLAKHLRRTVYPPESTWVAIGGNKRGYKRFPHFQMGINEGYLFVMLAFIDQPDKEADIADYFLSHLSGLEALPNDFCVIADHTQTAFLTQAQVDYPQVLTALKTRKKAEFMVGRLLMANDERLYNDLALSEWVEQTIQPLLSMYQATLALYNETREPS